MLNSLLKRGAHQRPLDQNLAQSAVLLSGLGLAWAHELHLVAREHERDEVVFVR